MRNKYEDSLNSLNNLLDAIRDENNKIIKQFKPLEINKKLRGHKVSNLRKNYIETDEELKRNKELTFDTRNYGYFKGLIRISEKSEYDKHKTYIKNIQNKFKGVLPLDLTFLTAIDDLGKEIAKVILFLGIPANNSYPSTFCVYILFTIFFLLFKNPINKCPFVGRHSDISKPLQKS